MEAEGVVVGLGQKSFTVLVPSLDLEHRLFLGDIPGLATQQQQEPAAATAGEQQEQDGVKTLTLRSVDGAAPGQLPPWGKGPWTLRLFDRVRVRAASKAEAVPLMVKLDLLGPPLAVAGVGACHEAK